MTRCSRLIDRVIDFLAIPILLSVWVFWLVIDALHLFQGLRNSDEEEQC